MCTVDHVQRKAEKTETLQFVQHLLKIIFFDFHIYIYIFLSKEKYNHIAQNIIFQNSKEPTPKEELFKPERFRVSMQKECRRMNYILNI